MVGYHLVHSRISLRGGAICSGWKHQACGITPKKPRLIPRALVQHRNRLVQTKPLQADRGINIKLKELLTIRAGREFGA